MPRNKQELKNITIKDVALAANVSIATVSRILNGKDGVSLALTERVQSTVKKMKYQLNDVARSLKIKESRSIGLIIPDIENPFFPALVRGVQDAAQMHNYAVILCNTDGRAEEENKYLQLLFSKRVDGMVFTESLENKKNTALLASSGIPVVLLDRRVEGMFASAVVTDNRLGAFMATEHLIQLGKKEIAFLNGSLKLSSGAERLSGYRDALDKYGLEYNHRLVLNGAFTYDSGYEATVSLLHSGQKFDAIFASNDMIAIGAIECLNKHNIQVPEEVGVVGFDDIRMAAWYKPSLTTIRQPVYEMGRQAVHMLVEQMSGVRKDYYEQIFMPELIVRESSGNKVE